MEDEFQKILEILQAFQKEKKTFRELLSENQRVKTWLKIDPFDYNMELYFSLSIMLEDENKNSVETSMEQIQLGKPIFENDLREKYIKTKEELLEELIAFQAHSRD